MVAARAVRLHYSKILLEEILGTLAYGFKNTIEEIVPFSQKCHKNNFRFVNNSLGKLKENN